MFAQRLRTTVSPPGSSVSLSSSGCAFLFYKYKYSFKPKNCRQGILIKVEEPRVVIFLAVCVSLLSLHSSLALHASHIPCPQRVVSGMRVIYPSPIKVWCSIPFLCVCLSLDSVSSLQNYQCGFHSWNRHFILSCPAYTF